MIAQRRHRSAPRGVALVSVLLIVAVTTALAYEIANRHAFGVAVSRQVLSGSQAREYALGGEQYARQLLYADWEDERTRSKDTLLEDWSSTTKAFEVDDGGIEMRIVDLSSRFNLNSVSGADGPQNAARLKRLFTQLGLDPKDVDAWIDWIDPDQEVQPYGAEDADYLLREPPHRAANQPAVDMSELRLAVPFESRDEYARLRPHVTVLPTDRLTININTVTEAVLASLAPNFPAADAQRLVEQVRDYDAVETVIASHAPLGASAAALRVGSRFFEVQVRAHHGGIRSELTSVLHRDPENGELVLLSRNFGRRVESTADEATAKTEG